MVDDLADADARAEGVLGDQPEDVGRVRLQPGDERAHLALRGARAAVDGSRLRAVAARRPVLEPVGGRRAVRVQRAGERHARRQHSRGRAGRHGRRGRRARREVRLDAGARPGRVRRDEPEDVGRVRLQPRQLRRDRDRSRARAGARLRGRGGEARRPVLEPVARREPAGIHRSRHLGGRRADRGRLPGRRRHGGRGGGEGGDRTRRSSPTSSSRRGGSSRSYRPSGPTAPSSPARRSSPEPASAFARPGREARRRGAVLEVVARLQPARAHGPVQRRRRRGDRRGLPRRGQVASAVVKRPSAPSGRARRVRRDDLEPVVPARLQALQRRA